MRRVFNISAIVSGIICGLFLVLLPVTYHVTLCSLSKSSGLAPHGSVSISSHTRCGASRGGLWFFSLDCPYTGSIMHTGDERGIFYEGGIAREVRDRSWIVGHFGFVQESFVGERGELVGRDRSADFPGIYYRHFVWWKRELPWWTFRLSLWIPILLSAVLPLLWILRRRGSWFTKTMPDHALRWRIKRWFPKPLE